MTAEEELVLLVAGRADNWLNEAELLRNVNSLIEEYGSADAAVAGLRNG